MSSSLPPEVLDLVFDYLRDQPTTLKACCLVSKSWVHGTRRHLFVRVELSGKSLIRSWMRAFPDPSNSQAHHARSLSIGIDAAVLTGDPDARAFIRSFHNILQLFVHTFWWDTPKVTFADFHGLSPTLTSLHLFHPSIQSSEVLDLICSFPLLEDLSLQIEDLTGDLDGWVAPSASPKLTGELLLGKRVHHVVCGLLDLPGGLHFTKITACIPVEDAELVVGLVSRCSHTLESLWIDYYPSSIPGLQPPLDFSKAKKLKELEIQCREPNVQWITTTLRTTRSELLRQITIALHVFTPAEGTVWEWHSLDHLLVQLWASRSILVKIVCKDDLRRVAESLLPELTSRRVGLELEND